MAPKLTIEQVKERIKKINQSNVTLIDETYIDTKHKATFVDSKYGNFDMLVYHVLRGHGHKKRGYEKNSINSRLSVEDFKKRLQNLRGDELILDESTYINANIKCKLIDKDYPNDEWWVKPNNVITGQKSRHPKRKKDRVRQTCINNFGVDNPSKAKEIREKAYQNNPQKLKIEYVRNILLEKGIKLLSQEYRNNKTKLKVECLKCGNIWMAPFGNLKNDHGCPGKECFAEKTRKTCQRNFGCDNPMQNKEIHNKMIQTCIERYGVKNISQPKGKTKETDEKIAKRAKERSENFTQEEKNKLSIKMKKQWEDGVIVPLKKSSNPHWKGGTSELTIMVRGNRKLYKEWKYPILQKFEFKCSLCGSTKKIEVHHDKERMCDIFKSFLLEPKKELNFEEKGKICDQVVQYHIDNKVSGIVLCKECHKKAHNKK